MKRKWIDNGRDGHPKTYTKKGWVLRLIRSILLEDIDTLKIIGEDVNVIHEDELLRIGADYYDIYEV